MPTKQQFLDTYRAKLREKHAWAQDEAKLTRFMESVRTTLNGGNTFCRDGQCYHETLKALGLPKRVSLKALHSLED